MKLRKPSMKHLDSDDRLMLVFFGMGVGLVFFIIAGATGASSPSATAQTIAWLFGAPGILLVVVPIIFGIAIGIRKLFRVLFKGEDFDF